MKGDMEKSALAMNSLAGRPQIAVRDEEMFAKVFAAFPWPTAIFDREGKIIMANALFCSLAGITAEDIPAKTFDILSFLNKENAEILNAMRGVFDGDTRVLKDLAHPLRVTPDTDEVSEYTSAVFFPVTAEYGAVFFRKEANG